ncbi:MAG: GGDEF domain-containing protein [Lachnospiraceae bacterium]|nr:GGDEF domain-containing protein [Lachnospiraceae bacterium]
MINNSSKEQPVNNVHLFLFFAMIAIALLLLSNVFYFNSSYKRVDFTEDWTVDNGDVVDIDDLVVGDYGGHMILTKTLPDKISYNEELCFIAFNINYSVFVDGVLEDSYTAKKNLTGYGYGNAYITVNLCPGDAGKVIRIDISSVFDNHKSGRIRMMTIERAQDFRARFAGGMLLPFIVSIAIFVMGLILLMLKLVVKRKISSDGTFTLGLMALIVGLWLANDTGFLRLIMGNLTFCRIVDHVCMHIWLLPFFFFIYSITAEQRKVFANLASIFTAVELLFVATARFAFDIDMAWLVAPIVVYYVVMAVLTVMMLCSDYKYRKKNAVQHPLDLFYAGFSVLLTGSIIDVIVYLCGVRNITGRGTFSRVGICIFFFLMALSSIRGYSHEQIAINRDRFINKMLHYAVSSSDPEEGIRAIMEHFGTEYNAAHVYIFENSHNGFFHNSYNWFRPGVAIPSADLGSDIPYHGLIDILYPVFMEDHHMILFRSEETRKANPLLYNTLKRFNIMNTVVGPLQCNGELSGMFGVDDAPEEKCNEIADIIWLLSYFISQLLVQRDERRNLERMSFMDSLTGVGNHRLMKRFEEESDGIVPFGFVMCDLNGLKHINDTLGHEAGDAHIVKMASCLVNVFGDSNVYRLGGDEFAAYAITDDRSEFDALINKLRLMLDSSGISASVGAVYNEDPHADKEKLKETADALMYKEKEIYYKGRNDRRR